jgi:hypothetical protein
MRNAGDRTPGRSPGHRQRAADAEQPSPGGGASLFTPAYRVSQPPTGSSAAGPGGAAGSGGPGGPGGRGGSSGPVWPDDDVRSAYSWATEDEDSAWPGTGLADRGTMAANVLSNAVRGFPPAPGEPLPVYPPGPFAAWNRGQSDRPRRRGGQAPGSRVGGHADASKLGAATITPDEFDTDYSLPAIKDPVPAQAGRAAAGVSTGLDQRPAGVPGGRARHGRPQRDDVQREQLPAAPGGGRARGKSGPAPRTRKKRQSAWLAIGTAVVIVAAVAAVLVLTSLGGGAPSGKPKLTSTPSPTGTSPTPPPGPWRYIGSRKTDAVPLTTGELYPSSISNAGTVYTRAAQATSKKCHPALIGTALRTAVSHAGCTQSLRATYLSKSAKVMGTIGVFNLKSYAVATNAASKAGHSEFVAQLAAKAGPAKAIGQGTGIEEALVKGHYLVLIWAEATDLNPPRSKAGRARLTAFMTVLFRQTVSISLSHRMAVGRPVKHD